MGPHIPAVGWQINSTIDATNIVFAEYRSVNESGALISTSGRHAKSKQLSAAQNTQYRDLNWFFNGWTPVVPSYGEKDCAGVVSGFAYLDDCAICVGGSTGKTACVKDCNGTINGTAVLDICSRCTAGTTGKTACTSVGEAETDACTFDGITENKNVGFKGSSYLNVDNSVGTAITFHVLAANAGVGILSFRYANGGTVDRPAQISLNGTVLPNNLSFPVTGTFVDWKAVDISFSLLKGINVLKVISSTAEGLPNIDQIGYVSAGVSKGSCVITGIEERKLLNEWIVFPNPSTNQFILHLPEKSDVKVTNIQGITIDSEIDIRDLQFGEEYTTGVYFVQITSNGIAKVLRIVKK